ncbi:MAG TPA: tol-pal system protein YbgF [Kofleriaceae bacterium]|nr:tol-pal system protein YbgF [Kofleriaceae bacterium]
MRNRCVLALLSAVGCAGAADRPAARSPSDSASELRAELRRERRTIHTLENEVALLRARLRDSQPPPPALPPAEVASAPPPVDPAPLPETLGASDEVEIVYEGEAAAEPTVRPRIEIHERTEPAPPPPPVTAPAERLPVLSGEVPTVQSQLRRARAAAPAAGPRRRPADPRAEYQRYLDAARAGNHDYAAQGLRSFLDQHPGHDLADNAQYWLAETYYARKRYALAAVEFEKVVERYPGGNKLPDALLKIGYCRAQAGKRAEAIAVLRRLVRAHPASAPAALARVKLEELDP